MRKKKNKVKTLDLHGYTADEVTLTLDRFITQSVRRGERKARVMTGKGQGIVQKTVIDYLKKAHYPWSYETLLNGKKNEGVLVVHLE